MLACRVDSSTAAELIAAPLLIPTDLLAIGVLDKEPMTCLSVMVTYTRKQIEGRQIWKIGKIGKKGKIGKIGKIRKKKERGERKYTYKNICKRKR